MNYKKEINSDQLNIYLDSLINKVFALLGIYEECENKNNYKNYLSYLNRLITEFSGFNKLFEIDVFLSLISILKGMTLIEDMCHSKVKSLTFHCISVIKKEKVR